MILVTGANGTNGKAICQRLVEAGQAVRVLVRHADKAANLGKVDVAIGDLSDAASVKAALQGVERALLLTPVHEKAPEWANSFIQAAQGVHIVKFSGMGATHDSVSLIMRQHADTDETLRQSGLNYTILQPNSFYQNMLWLAGAIAAQNAFYLPLAQARQSMVDVNDIADVAVQALTGAGHEGKTYVVTGPESLSGDDVASVLTRVLGRPVAYVAITGVQVEQNMLAAGDDAWGAREVGRLMESFSDGKSAEVTDVVAKVAGHPARTFEQFVRDNQVAFNPR